MAENEPLPSSGDLDRASRLAQAVQEGARKARERLDEDGATWETMWTSLGAIAGVGLRGLLLVLERAGPIAADVAADAIVGWLESQKERPGDPESNIE